MALVDVIIPTKNRVSLTLAAVESVLCQTLTDVRVIVVDDNSDPNSFTTLADQLCNRERVLVVRRSSDGGEGGARQTGYENSDAPFVALLDSDDIWLPSKLERQVDLARQQDFPCTVITWSRWIDSQGREISSHEPESRRRPSPLSAANMSVPLYQREVLESIGGILPAHVPNPLPTAAGIELSVRVSQAAPIAVVPEYLTECHHHSGSRESDKTRSLESALAMEAVYDIHQDVFGRFPRDEVEILSIIGTRFISGGHFVAGWRYLGHAIRQGAFRYEPRSTVRRVAWATKESVEPRRFRKH